MKKKKMKIMRKKVRRKAAGEEKDGKDPMEIWPEEDEVNEGGEEKKGDALVPGGSSV